MAKKDYANRPSTPWMKKVRARDGRTVENRAYDPRAARKRKQEKYDRAAARTEAMSSRGMSLDKLDENTDKILDFIHDPDNSYKSDKTRQYVDGIGAVRDNMDKELKKILRRKDVDMDDVFQKRQELKSASIDYIIAKEELDSVEDSVARRLEYKLKKMPVAEHWDGDNLGSASKFGEAEELSEEWLNLRKNGIGGSEVLEAAGLKNELYARTGKVKKMSDVENEWNLVSLANDKLSPAIEEDVENERSGAAWRGHVWEEALLAEYKGQTGMRVAQNKATWKGDEDYQLVNIDGLVLDDDGNPEGIVECKVSENKDLWANGVPPAYRAQALYQLDATGLEYADVMARVGGEYQRHRIYKGETIDGTPDGETIDDVKPRLQEKWDKIQEHRQRGTTPQIEKRKPIGESNFAMGEASDNVTALMGGRMSRSEVSKQLKEYRAREGSLDAGVRKFIGDNFDRSKMGKLAGVDGETASIVSDSFDGDRRKFSANYDDWIETGVVTIDSSGKRVDELQQFHGVDKRIADRVGTGAVDVHGISMNDIRDKPRITDSPGDVQRALLNGDVLVAHNAGFEKSHLYTNVPGIEGKRPVLDTKWLSTHFGGGVGEGKGNSLSDFCADNNVEYTGAHRAKQDAGMMMDALNNFMSRDKWWEKK